MAEFEDAMLEAMHRMQDRLVEKGYIKWHVENDATGEGKFELTERGARFGAALHHIFSDKIDDPGRIDFLEFAVLAQIILTSRPA